MNIKCILAYDGTHYLGWQKTKEGKSIEEELSLSTFRVRRLWYPFFSDMRKLDGFADLITELGLEAFYRTYDWPDYCRPLGDDDFECF